MSKNYSTETFDVLLSYLSRHSGRSPGLGAPSVRNGRGLTFTKLRISWYSGVPTLVSSPATSPIGTHYPVEPWSTSERVLTGTVKSHLLLETVRGLRYLGTELCGWELLVRTFRRLHR